MLSQLAASYTSVRQQVIKKTKYDDAILNVCFSTGVVHLNGGTAAFICALFLGPRKHQFDPDAEPPKPGNGINILLGTFVLW